ncbi:MAG: MBL fold metallo-hydrolase [Cardiobacteriaceae bacterium]|nr:MBL fold metallo-hydrolase [Cardiobacteriaceae bacterium]
MSDHYSSEKKTFYNTPPTASLHRRAVLRSLTKMYLQRRLFLPPTLLPIIKPNWSHFIDSSYSNKYIWLGHSSLMLRLQDQTIMIDPVLASYAAPVPFVAPRYQAAPIQWNELPSVDTVIYSHNHYDHLDRAALKYFALSDTRFFVPLGLGRYLKNKGIAESRITECDWWQHVEYKGIHYHAVPARHYSGRSLFDRNHSLWAGWVLQQGSEQLYYSGDSAFPGYFSEIAERFKSFDLAFIENGQYDAAWPDNHMTPVETIKAASIVKAKRFMPVHWGAYLLAPHAWDEPVRQSIPLAKSKGISTLTPLQGQVFDKNSETDEWWLNLKRR